MQMMVASGFRTKTFVSTLLPFTNALCLVVELIKLVLKVNGKEKQLEVARKFI